MPSELDLFEEDESEIDRFIRLQVLPVPDDSTAYWQTRSIEERLARLEALREAYAQTLPPERRVFQRVACVIQRKSKPAVENSTSNSRDIQ
jgi:hypothetical protein